MQRIRETFDSVGIGAAQRIALLASVRSAVEARLAFKHHVDIVDIKEPALGSLGRAAEATIRQILEDAPQAALMSVAMGELVDADSHEVQTFLENVDSKARIAFVKFGLAKMRNDPKWIYKWTQVCRHIPKSISPVAVAYADINNALSPDVSAVIETGQRLGCSAFLLDTFDKSQGNTFHYVTAERLRAYRNDANRRGMKFVLAGSLRMDAIQKLADIQPQVVGVRGALCRQQQRAEEIDEESLIQFLAELKRIRGNDDTIVF